MKIVLPREVTGQEIADAVEHTAKCFGVRPNIARASTSQSPCAYAPMFREKNWRGEETIGFWFTPSPDRKAATFFDSQALYSELTLHVSLSLFVTDLLPWTLWVADENDPLFERVQPNMERVANMFLVFLAKLTEPRANDPV